ncbi:MAG: winged helix-turn-helix domain-containing protein [Pseudomonadota bacterium]
MHTQPGIAAIGAMIGDPTRSAMLSSLMSGQAMTATELADEGGITRQTASVHLARLMDAGMIRMLKQGRHRYFSLASEDVSVMLESMMTVAQQVRPSTFRAGPKDKNMRKARVCYDHLAGPYSVAIYEAFIRRNFLTLVQPTNDENGILTLTHDGKTFCSSKGIDIQDCASKRVMCRPCVDWSERRFHIAGALGHALLAFVFEQGWAEKERDSRIVTFSSHGLKTMSDVFGIDV